MKSLQFSLASRPSYIKTPFTSNIFKYQIFKMKTALPFIVLAVLVAGYQAEIVKSAATRANLNVGWVNTGDLLLYQGYVVRQAIANTIQSQDLVYRGNSTTRINAIQASEVGYTQHASARIVTGGLNANNVTLQFTSYRSYGFHYLVRIWGRVR